MGKNLRQSNRGADGLGFSGRIQLALIFGLWALVILALPLSEPAPAAAPAPSPAAPVGKVLEELNYRVDIWIWQDALKAKMVFQEVAPGRYRAELNGYSQGLLSLITGDWRGSLSTEMVYSQGKLRPLVYREISSKRGKKRVMEYRFDYAQNKVELWKSDKDQKMVKRWETTLKENMYDPLTFFYSRRLTGNPLGAKGGETMKFQGIPYPKPEEIVLRVGTKTTKGRKIMLEMGDKIFKGERSQIYAYLDNDGVPTKAWTKVLKFGEVDIKLIPGGKRVKKEEVTAAPDQARTGRN
jgi:hypothetical protein